MTGRRFSQPYVTRNQQRAAALRRQSTVANIRDSNVKVKRKKLFFSLTLSFPECGSVEQKSKENPRQHPGPEKQETQRGERHHSDGSEGGSLDR